MEADLEEAFESPPHRRTLCVAFRLSCFLPSCPQHSDSARVTRAVALQSRPAPQSFEGVGAASAASPFPPPPSPPRPMHAAASLHVRLTATSVPDAPDLDLQDHGIFQRAFLLYK
jgi:hypothetical protein